MDILQKHLTQKQGSNKTSVLFLFSMKTSASNNIKAS